MSVELHTLSNGLRVVSERMPGLHSAAIGIWIAAGGRHERASQNGIAHFLEHMAFKGTTTRSAAQIAEAIEDVGGYINAYTGRETTAFYARVLEADVGIALDVLADILLNPVFDPREIEVERGVILQEIGQALDTPDDIVFDWLQEAAFPEQPLGRSILGPAERVGAFTREDLAGFVAERYGPEQMIVSAAGAVDHDSLCRAAERLFGHLPRRALVPIQGAAFRGGERREVKRLEQVHFTLAFEAPGYCDPDLFTAQTHASALGGGMSSRLFQEARERRGLCYTIFAQSSSYADSGLLTLYAGTSREQIGELAALAIDEIRRMAEDTSEAEVARAKAQMKAGLLMGLESSSSRAERTARLLKIWGRPVAIEETIERIDAVTVQGVRDFSARIAQRATAAMALYGPVTRAPALARLTERLAA